MWVVPAGAGNTARQIMLIRDFHVTCIHATPSYAMHIAERMVQEGDDPRSLGLKIAFLGAEPYTEELRVKLQEIYGFKGFNSYGLSEMNGPGVAFECSERGGMHIWEDAYLVEVVNPETLQPVAEGEVGELVLTTLRRTAMPIIRYRTRDLTSFVSGECPCGRRHVRLARMVGRSDDMLIVRGVNVFPSQIEEVLMRHKWLGGNYIICLTTAKSLDEMTVKVELAQGSFEGSVEKLRAQRGELQRQLKEQIGFTAALELVEPGSLPASEGKAKRVIDERNVALALSISARRKSVGLALKGTIIAEALFSREDDDGCITNSECLWKTNPESCRGSRGCWEMPESTCSHWTSPTRASTASSRYW